MKMHTTFLSLVLFFALQCLAHSQDQPETRDQTLAPYFIVLTDDPTLDQLPLQSTSAEINIAGVIANVKVTQIYKNDGLRPIEAIYVFPLSTNAAVYSMKMTVGDVLINAVIKEREEARQEFEDARDEGKTASLLEQNRPNVFQMNVTNILPGDNIKVDLEYVELLVPENGQYELIYPAVVGPRYSELQTDEATDTETWVETPYQHSGEDALYDFNVTAHINSGIPIQRVDSPSHEITVSQPDELSADIVLATTERAGLKDYKIRYNLRDNEIQSGVLLYEHEDENFFLVMVEPPARFEEDDIPPREYIFVLDVSGSMNGFPLNTAQTFLSKLLSELRPNDVFNVMAFSGGSSILFPISQQATPDVINNAVSMVNRYSSGGGTRLLSALQNVYSLPLYSDELSRNIVIITDGFINAEFAVFDKIRENMNIANVFSVGIGSSPNIFLIEGMARVGQGEPLLIQNSNEIDDRLERYKDYIKSPLLTHINTDFNDFNAYDIEPPSVPDLLAQRPLTIIGKYHGEAQGSLSVSGQSVVGEFRKTFDLSSVMPNEANSALRYLWARKRIQLKSDYVEINKSLWFLEQNDQQFVEEITQLGLQYNLLTPYTSFIAVYDVVRNEDGNPDTVNQPLPLPDGVEDTALPGPQPTPVPPSQPNPGGGAVGIKDWQLYESIEDVRVNKPSSSPSQAMYTYTATVIEVIDGSTLMVEIDGAVVMFTIDSLAETRSISEHEHMVALLKKHVLNQIIKIISNTKIQTNETKKELKGTFLFNGVSFDELLNSH